MTKRLRNVQIMGFIISSLILQKPLDLNGASTTHLLHCTALQAASQCYPQDRVVAKGVKHENEVSPAGRFLHVCWHQGGILSRKYQQSKSFGEKHQGISVAHKAFFLFGWRRGHLLA